MHSPTNVKENITLRDRLGFPVDREQHPSMCVLPRDRPMRFAVGYPFGSNVLKQRILNRFVHCSIIEVISSVFQCGIVIKGDQPKHRNGVVLHGIPICRVIQRITTRCILGLPGYQPLSRVDIDDKFIRDIVVCIVGVNPGDPEFPVQLGAKMSPVPYRSRRQYRVDKNRCCQVARTPGWFGIQMNRP